MRDGVKIFFDTVVKDDQTIGVSVCKEVDEDPFNNCEPVSCTIHYNGKKPFYDTKMKRCVRVPKCVSKFNRNLPNVVYNPKSNRCIKDNTVIQDDLNYVKSLIRHSNRVTKDIVIIKKTKQHGLHGVKDASKYIFDSDLYTTNTENTPTYKPNKAKSKFKKIFAFAMGDDPAKLTHDKKYHKLRIDEKNVHVTDTAKSTVCSSILEYLSANRCAFMVLSAITGFQLCLLCWLLYYLSTNVVCRCRKILERHYFNYHQDVSVTTPLIGTSNIETETTCQFMTESSNIDRKIQCYKSCQKDQAKLISLSDDILSKCLNRRKWELKQTKSHNMEPEFASFNDNTDFKNTMMRVSEYQQYSVYTADKADEQKLSYESEKPKPKKSAKSKSSKTFKKSQSISKQENKTAEIREYTDSDVVSSERVLKCHSFNYMGEEKPVADIKLSTSEIYCNYKCSSTQTSLGRSQVPDKLSESKNITGFKPKSESREVFTCTELRNSSKTRSSEKGAQASFTNDSLDDYLSERGMLFLTGEDLSKYSNASDILSLSSVSSKTSKNYILKNVMSIFRRKSKQHVSDPGPKKSKESINLELIHMSRPTVYSSSNVGSDYTNLTTKKTRESRSSL